MGCAVNGPGRPGDADFGIAGGRDVGFVYAHGRVLKKVPSEVLIDELFPEIDAWIESGMKRPKRLKMAKPAALAMAEASLIPLGDSSARTWSPGSLSSSSRPCARRRRTPRRSRTSCSCAAATSARCAAGVWTFLPLGWRVHQKDRPDHPRGDGRDRRRRRCSCPCSRRRALGRRPAASTIPEIFRLEDRDGSRVRPAADARGDRHVPRARDPELPAAAADPLPLSDKDRDEPRPRGGLLRRARVHHEGRLLVRPRRGGRPLEASANREAYNRIFERCGLETTASQAESGMMGGKVSDRLPRALRLGREHARHLRERRLRRGSRDRARRPAPADLPERLDAPEEVETPGVTTIEALADFLSHRPAATSKAMPVVDRDGTLVLALVRGDDRLEEAKLAAALGATLRPATDDEIRARVRGRRRLARSGRLHRSRSSPTRRCARGSSSPARTATAGTCAGSRRAATTSRASPTSASRARATAAPTCGGALRFQTAIEVGHIFKLDTRYSEPLGATFLDEDGPGAADPDAAATASARRGSWPRPSSSTTTRTASPGRRRSRPTTSTSLRFTAAVDEVLEHGGDSGQRPSTRRASRFSSTTATSDLVRSSPTRT